MTRYWQTGTYPSIGHSRLEQADLQQQVEVEVGAVVGQEMAEEPLGVPIVEWHGGLAQDADDGMRWVHRPVRILSIRLLPRYL